MKVLNLVTTPRPFFDNQIKSIQKVGVEVDILTVPEPKSQEDARSITDYIKYYPHVIKEQFKEYDIVHANFGNTAPFAVLQPTRPIIITYWGTDLMGRFGSINSKFAHLFDHVILPSPILSKYVTSDYHVVPFPIDTDLFRPIPRRKARSEIGWELNKKYVLFPYSKTRNEKNYPLAERIINQLDTDVELVTITGVDYERMPYYMNASDAILITSKRESGPMIVKEGALCNVPVVSTDVGFASQVLSKIDNSYVCSNSEKLKNRLKTVIESRGRSDGRKHTNEWCLQKMGERLISIYQSALDKQ